MEPPSRATIRSRPETVEIEYASSFGKIVQSRVENDLNLLPPHDRVKLIRELLRLYRIPALQS